MDMNKEHTHTHTYTHTRTFHHAYKPIRHLIKQVGRAFLQRLRPACLIRSSMCLYVRWKVCVYLHLAYKHKLNLISQVGRASGQPLCVWLCVCVCVCSSVSLCVCVFVC